MGAIATSVAALTTSGTGLGVANSVVASSVVEGLGMLAYGALVVATIFVASRWAAQAFDVEAGGDSSARTRDANAPRSGA